MIRNTQTRSKPLALVVDDDPTLRLYMCTALRKAGFEAVEADGGSIALDIFPTTKPDLILLDLMMPDMDGFETCKAIRKLPGGVTLRF